MEKILYITNISDLNKYKDKNRLYKFNKIKKNDNFLVLDVDNIKSLDMKYIEEQTQFKSVCVSHESSPGHPRCKKAEKIKKIIRKFDKKFVYLEDLHRIEKNILLLSSLYTDVIFTVEGHKAKKFKEKMSCNYHTIPHHINTDLMKKYETDKIYDVLLFGSQESKYYPFRSRLSKLFGNTNGINFKLVRPSGKYWGKKLSELINQSWLTVSTTSVYDYLVCKYFEISASNSVVLGNLDNIGKTIWNNSDYINIEPNMSDSQIVKIVKKSLDDKNNLLKIGERMGKKIRDNFSTESYVTKLVEIIRRR